VRWRRDRRACGSRFVEHRIDVVTRANVVGERDPAKGPCRRELRRASAILRECVATPQCDDHSAGLKEDDVVVCESGRPSHAFVERFGTCEVADTKGDEADTLVHGRGSQ